MGWASFLCELPLTCSTLGCTTETMIQHSCLKSRNGIVGSGQSPGLV